ncbi:BHLH domain-containing protein [Mycena chlorophos]|uniref:Uncharacterized protein n=2 Tax=Mycena chlorophos TaxID=658473 RepID=A0ABQ0LC90_MYCCL|nr:BHLH domain-containing protein [Mycena chlorophos]GAT48708.1 predicted protein [Mycena chlorophos]
MTLLTKTETTQLDAFLDNMDYDAYVGREWQMYGQQQEPADAAYNHDKSQLTKATKDLMALDYPQYQHQPSYYYQNHPMDQYPQQQQLPMPPRQPSFPFLHQQRPPAPSLTIAGGPHIPHPEYPTPTNSTPSTASTSTSGYSFPPSPVTSRRPSPKETPAPPIASGSKRPRAAAQQPTKPALLSASQKKANHIQSEQKRRANIRRGYEALCESVPALREAIREEEAAQAARQAQSEGSSKGKRSRGRGRSGDDGAEKTDGRAGPRSENVVLSKTIDYLNELLAEREALGTRLERARAALPPGHPALVPDTPDPLWEREWKGGLGNNDEDEEDEEEPPY